MAIDGRHRNTSTADIHIVPLDTQMESDEHRRSATVRENVTLVRIGQIRKLLDTAICPTCNQDIAKSRR
jgi:hypothetical protein